MQTSLQERDLMKTTQEKKPKKGTQEGILDNGYNAWLAYKAFNKYAAHFQFDLPGSICVEGSGTIMDTAIREWNSFVKSVLGKTQKSVQSPTESGSTIIVLLSDNQQSIIPVTEDEKDSLGCEGYIIKSCKAASGNHLLIAAKTGSGILYGVFSLIRMICCGKAYPRHQSGGKSSNGPTDGKPLGQYGW